MANIFDIPTKQTYVDTYVPLPFQAIAAIGDKIEKQNADTESSMSQLEGEIAKQKVTDQLLTGTNRSVKTGQTEFKNNLLKDIRTQFNDLSEQQAAGKIDSNEFNQRYKNIKNSFVEKYELLKKYSADTDQIEKQNELIRQDKNATGESSILNKVYDVNKQYIKDMNTMGYSGAPIYNFVNEMEAVNQTASGFSPQDIGSIDYVDKRGILHIGRTSGTTKARVESLVDNSYNGLGIAQQHRNRVERDIDDGKYLDSEGNPITFNAPVKVTRKINGVNKEIETTFGENEIFKSKENFKAAVVQKAVSNHLTENIMEDPATKARREAAIKEQEEKSRPMPNLQNQLKTDKDKTTAKSGLKWLLGHDIDIIKDDGTAITSAGIFASKYNVKQYGKDGKVKSTQIFYNLEDAKKAAKDLTYVVSQEKSDAKDMERKLVNHYVELVNTAKGLGMTLPMKTNDRSKVNYDLLQKQLSDYGQNMEMSGNSTAAFQARFSTNLSNYFLGEVTADSDGKIGFKKSPSLGNSKITDLTTGEDVDSKEEVAKDGVIKGINYYADQPGTYRVDSKNKSYNLDAGDNTLKAMTKNTHSFTQGILRARQGKQTSKTVIDNNNNTIGDYAVSIVNNLKENFKTIPANNPQGLILANHLNENLNKLNGYEPVNISPSDILIKEGPRKGTPKYNYIAYENKGFGTTNEADDLILRIDAESSQTEVITLGDVHSDERDYLQKIYESAFEPTKTEKK